MCSATLWHRQALPKPPRIRLRHMLPRLMALQRMLLQHMEQPHTALLHMARQCMEVPRTVAPRAPLRWCRGRCPLTSWTRPRSGSIRRRSSLPRSTRTWRPSLPRSRLSRSSLSQSISRLLIWLSIMNKGSHHKNRRQTQRYTHK